MHCEVKSVREVGWQVCEWSMKGERVGWAGV